MFTSVTEACRVQYRVHDARAAAGALLLHLALAIQSPKSLIYVDRRSASAAHLATSRASLFSSTVRQQQQLMQYAQASIAGCITLEICFTSGILPSQQAKRRGYTGRTMFKRHFFWNQVFTIRNKFEQLPLHPLMKRFMNVFVKNIM